MFGLSARERHWNAFFFLLTEFMGSIDKPTMLRALPGTRKAWKFAYNKGHSPQVAAYECTTILLTRFAYDLDEDAKLRVLREIPAADFGEHKERLLRAISSNTFDPPPASLHPLTSAIIRASLAINRLADDGLLLPEQASRFHDHVTAALIGDISDSPIAQFYAQDSGERS